MSVATLPDDLADALADALGRVVADVQREWRRDVERLSAESRAIVAELRADVVTLKAALKDEADRQAARVADAIMVLPIPKDGAAGKDADPDLVAGIVTDRLSVEIGEAIRSDVALIRADVAAIAGGVDEKVAAQVSLKIGEQPDMVPVIAEMVAATVAALPVPKDGKDADPAVIAEMVADEVAKLPPAEPGKSVDPEELRASVIAEIDAALKARPVPADGHTPTTDELAPLVETAVSRAVAALPEAKNGEDGKSIEPAAVADMIAGEVAKAVAALPAPKDGESIDPAEVERMVTDAVAKLPLPERGPEGPPGKFVAPKTWSRGIHYESVLVAHAGSTWCAMRDTADEPPHEDWVLVAARGADAPVGEVRGLHDETKQYQKFDLVAWNGSEWRAKHDDPGPLPGEGWAMSAKVGKSGKPGDPGSKGDPGPPGKPGPAIDAWRIDGYRATPLMGDGAVGPALDVREFFELYHGEARR